MSSRGADGFTLLEVLVAVFIMALVTYSASPSPEGEGLVLLRQEEPLPAQLAKQVEWTSAQTVADNVASFVLRFSGEDDLAVEGWDSTTAAQLDQIGRAHV